MIIVGAPRCGTTSVFHWLTEHPEVVGSLTKETRFFIDESYVLQPEDPGLTYYHRGMAAYEDCFPSQFPTGRRVAIEATPDYMYQRTALEQIANVPGEPKIVFFLRKPSDRLYSIFQFARNNSGAVDPNLTFPIYVEGVLRGGPPDQRFAANPMLAQGLEQTRYADWLNLWHERYGANRIRVVVFEDMRRDAHKILNQLAMDLGIDPEFYANRELKTHNDSYEVRSHTLHRLINPFRGTSFPEPLRSWVSKTYRMLNTKPRKRSDAERAAHRELDAYFEAPNRQLARDYGLDLSAWGCPPQPAGATHADESLIPASNQPASPTASVG